MRFATLYSSNSLFRSMLKTSVFVVALSATVFSASAGYGLLKMLLSAESAGTNVGIAEFSTHSALTIVFFVFAGLSAYVAKKCFW